MEVGNIKNVNDSLSTNEKCLTHKVVGGGFWTFSLKIVTSILGLARTFILAKFLIPEEFGLMGVALMVISCLYTFSQTGIGKALIQKKESVNAYLDTAWLISIFRGTLISLLLFWGAPLFANFFQNENIAPILKILALSPLIYGFAAPTAAYFQREFMFKKRFALEVVSSLIEIVVTILLICVLRNIWALVWGFLCGSVARTFGTYIVLPYRPKFKFSLQKGRVLLSFGKWIFLSSVLSYLITQGDNLVAGKVLGIAALGYYIMAYRISNLPTTEFTHLISEVTLPAYSKLQFDIPRLRKAYSKVITLTSFFSFLVAGLIFISIADFTTLFLGDKWIPMVSSVKVLVWWGVIRSIIASISPVFVSLGKPNEVTKMQAVQVLIFALLIYPFAVHFNILGISITVFLSGLAMFFARTNFLIKTLQFKMSVFYKSFTVPFLVTILSVVSTELLKQTFSKYNGISSFILTVTGYLMIFIFYLFVSYRFFNYDVIDILKLALRQISVERAV